MGRAWLGRGRRSPSRARRPRRPGLRRGPAWPAETWATGLPVGADAVELARSSRRRRPSSTSPFRKRTTAVTTAALAPGSPCSARSRWPQTVSRGAVAGRGRRRSAGELFMVQPVPALLTRTCRRCARLIAAAGRHRRRDDGVLQGAALRRVPRRDGPSAARGHGHPPVRPRPVPARRRAGRGRSARPTTRPGAGTRGDASGDAPCSSSSDGVRFVFTGSWCSPGAGDVLERLLAGQRRAAARRSGTATTSRSLEADGRHRRRVTVAVRRDRRCAGRSSCMRCAAVGRPPVRSTRTS